MYNNGTGNKTSITETILLVEDNSNVRQFLREFLEGQGYILLESGNGLDALRMSEQYKNQIHLLLTDVVLPGLSGQALAEKMKRLRTGLKVLYMSGYGDEAITRYGIASTDTTFLQKPFDIATLNQALCAALNS